MAQAAQATSKLLDDHRAGKDISVKEIDDARATYNGLMKGAAKAFHISEMDSALLRLARSFPTSVQKEFSGFIIRTDNNPSCD